MTENEIIQALRICATHKDKGCGLCPQRKYVRCTERLADEAITMIERLTAENVALREGASLGKVKRSQKQAYEKQIKFLQALANRQLSEIKKLQKDLCWKDLEADAAEWKQERAEAERDAALADLADVRSCKTCKYACDTRDCSSCKSKTCKCLECHLDKIAWEWRGLPEAPEEGDT